ncbi:MAG: hypothetical protein OXG91_12670 [bacterium]|nr:hypothetical protein [bacterium]MCY3953727.1 hypothetical protein [bacterium]
MSSPAPAADGAPPPQWLLVASRAGTAVLCVAIVLGAVWPHRAGAAAQVVALVLFGAGSLALLRAYAVAVRRSRLEQVSTMAAFVGMPGAPRSVRVELRLAAGLQFAAGLTGAAVRPFGPLAFGILAGVYGLGVIALWGAGHGEFPSRSPRAARRRDG